MANLAETVFQRKVCRRDLDSLWRLVEETKIEPIPDQIEQAKTRLTSLPSIVSEYKTCLFKMMAHPDYASQEEDLLLEYDLFNEDVTRVKTICQKYPFTVDQPNDSVSQPELMNTAFLSNTQSSQAHARLPKLELPTFSGHIAEWTSYFELFTNAVDNNETLAPAQKFQYLKSTLTGEPFDLIKNTPLTEANYDSALALLKSRYDQPRLIAAYHLQKLLDLQSLHNTSYNHVVKFVSAVNEHVEALRALNEKVDTCRVLTFLLVNKLDYALRNKFESHVKTNHLPDLPILLNFLTDFIKSQQWQTLNNGTKAVSQPSTSYKSNAPSSISRPQYSNTYRAPTKPQYTKSSFVTTLATLHQCLVCEKPHTMYNCEKFIKLTPSERFTLIKRNHHCFNCLSASHSFPNCKSKHRCKICQKSHHTLLHFSNTNPVNVNTPNTMPLSSHTQTITSPDRSGTSPAVTLTAKNETHQVKPATTVLLGTALIRVTDCDGNWHHVRALFDNGSQSTLMTDECRQRLNLPLTPSTINISGVSNLQTNNVQGTTRCCMSSRYNQKSFRVSAVVLTNIVSHLPHHRLPVSALPNLKHLSLADPNFNEPGPVDLLIGADLYFSIITGQQYRLDHGPYAIETVFGWVISGPIEMTPPNIIQSCLTTNDDLMSTLRKFWELEEVECNRTISAEDQLAEQLFETKHHRTKDGRYVAPLIFRSFPPTLGKSFYAAESCYRGLRTRLLKDNSLRADYCKFMQDYLDTGHMSRVDMPPSNISYYIPHHCVLRPDSTTTKLRVVFNGSKKSSNGNSLNSELLTGPALQVDLPKLIMNQRLHKIILTADIKQMYRQILISPEHTGYQLILWNFSLDLKPEVYKLHTVTYGTSCAPYLALRTLRQLVCDEGAQFPAAAKALSAETFVDDVITGSNTVTEAIQLKTELIELLAKAGMELRKWACNYPEVLADLPDDHKQLTDLHSLDPDRSVKILGLVWKPSDDTFSYSIQLPDSQPTKRQILSEAARIFDPVGWISATTVVAKQFIQSLWRLGLDWDAPVPNNIASKWQEYKSQLPHLRDIAIPRFVATKTQSIQLVGFCDASEKGYAAVLYFRTINEIDQISIHLVTAKTKVAPVKQISLPRLELCAALLLAHLVDMVKRALPIEYTDVYLFSDSTITLAWIGSPPQRWKTFVANRVTQIQEVTTSSNWHHIISSENPADCASRGILPADLPNHPLWWTGPSWLTQQVATWPLSHQLDLPQINDLTSLEENPVACLIVEEHPDDSIFLRWSSFEKLVVVTSLCYRFCQNSQPQSEKQTGFISVVERHQTTLKLTKLVQATAFPEEMKQIRENRLRNRQLIKLHPFFDHDGTLRVGGRLRHSDRSFDFKHPILLPRKHPFTLLLITHYHEKYFHAAPRVLQTILQRKFWILGARTIIRHQLSKCIKCYRCSPSIKYPLMGDLPHHRVTPSKPFEKSGVDYGGPFLVTPFKGRGYKTTKAYICLFICFTTKAVHLELASDLTTETFIAAFRRFVARRGRCAHIFSDGGTNFIGAKAHFSELQQFIVSQTFNNHVTDQLATEGITWHINPPSAPHFGGLWEAGIKSVKFHLARVIGDQVLTYEEFSTALCQIEAILNSRPLCPLSTDPNDFEVLTPSHFLTSEAAVGLPEPSVQDENLHLLSRWKLVQRVQQDFWKRWSNEYLGTLQQRQKWTSPQAPLIPDQLVLIKNNNLPPLQWKMGRVIGVSPGRDDVTRVVKLKTATGILTRPVVKLAPLPINPTSNG